MLPRPAGAALQPQESHVHRRYVKSSDLTLIASDILYVINRPTQFMELQFEGRHPGQSPPAQGPVEITLLLRSYSTGPLYQKDEAHRLAVKADAEVFDFGLTSYALFRESGKDTYTSDQKSRLGLSSPIPDDTLVRTANKGKALTLESMSVSNVPLDRITKLARAGQVLMKVGDTVFALTPTQLNILREFAASVTPAGSAAAGPAASFAAPAIPPDVPSGANNAPLEQTLKWLKKELPRSGAEKGVYVPGRIEVVDFDSCKIKYRIVPLFRTSRVSASLVHTITEYQFDLADINPETVRASDLEDFSMLSFSTVNHERKIKVVTRANDYGMAGRTLDETMKPAAVLNLSNADSAARIKAAFVHAVGLCRPRT